MIKRKHLEGGGDSGDNNNHPNYATQDDINAALAQQKQQDQAAYAQQDMTAEHMKGASLAYDPSKLPQSFTQGFQPQTYQNVAAPPNMYGRGYGNSGGGKMPASGSAYGPQGGSGGGKMPASGSAYGPQGGSGGGKMPASGSAYGPQQGGGFRAPPTGHYAHGGFADGGETDPMTDTDQGNPYAGQVVSEGNPTWRDRLASGLLSIGDRSGEGGSGPSESLKQGVSNLVGSSGAGTTNPALVDLVPGVGQVLGAQEALQGGDYKGAAMSVMPMGGPSGAAAIRMGEARLMNKLAAEGKAVPGQLPHSSVMQMDEMFNKADRELPHFHSTNQQIADQAGAKYKDAPLKGIPRSVEKTGADYAGDASKMKDLVRGTFVVNTPDEANNLIRSLHENHQVESNGYRNLLDPNITPVDGYRDAKMNVKLPSGISGEIQINYPEMLEAKAIAHKLYEERRTIEGSLGNRQPSQMEADKIESLNNQMKQVYDQAYARVLDRSERSKTLNLPSEMGAPLRRAESGGNGRGLGLSQAVQYATAPGNGPNVTGMPSTSKNDTLFGSAIGNTSNPSLAGAGGNDNDIVAQAMRKLP